MVGCLPAAGRVRPPQVHSVRAEAKKVIQADISHNLGVFHPIDVIIKIEPVGCFASSLYPGCK